MTPSVNHIYNTRMGKRKRYTKQTHDMAHIIHHAMKQVSMKRILSKWGKKVEDEVSRDIKHFHTIEAFSHLDPPYMAYKYNTTMLEHLMLLQENWDFSIKER